MIVLTVPLFFWPPDKRLCLFVEEPELYLHPGQQRALLDVWIEYGHRCQIFATTHSTHFLDRTADTKALTVLRFEKQLPQGDDEEKLAEFQITR